VLGESRRVKHAGRTFGYEPLRGTIPLLHRTDLMSDEHPTEKLGATEGDSDGIEGYEAPEPGGWE